MTTILEDPWRWWLGCSEALRLVSDSKEHRKMSREALCAIQICRTESELEVAPLCSPIRSRWAPDVPPISQLLTSWWYLQRVPMPACDKFVTGKCLLNMDRRLLAQCSNRFVTQHASRVTLPSSGHPCHSWFWAEDALFTPLSQSWRAARADLLATLPNQCLVTARKAKQAKIYLNPVDGNPPGMHTRLGSAEGEGRMYTQVKIKTWNFSDYTECEVSVNWTFDSDPEI